MARTGISRQQVFAAATQLGSANQLPTALKIRAILATGSVTTIQKHLQEWKKSCFKQENLNIGSNVSGYQNNSELIEEKLILEQNLHKQIAQAECYASELINAERTIIALKAQNDDLQITVSELQKELQKVKTVNDSLQIWYQNLQIAIESSQNQTIKEQQQIINDLRLELKTLNETSLTAIRDTSTQGHEALMQEKIANINLQEKVASLNKQITELQKQLQTTSNIVEAKQQPLLRHIAWQQKIIQNHVGFDKLKQIEEQELQQKFNYKVGEAHG